MKEHTVTNKDSLVSQFNTEPTRIKSMSPRSVLNDFCAKLLPAKPAIYSIPIESNKSVQCRPSFRHSRD